MATGKPPAKKQSRPATNAATPAPALMPNDLLADLRQFIQSELPGHQRASHDVAMVATVWRHMGGSKCRELLPVMAPLLAAGHHTAIRKTGIKPIKSSTWHYTGRRRRCQCGGAAGHPGAITPETGSRRKLQQNQRLAIT